MDKILANKFLGLKVEDILKCLVLVGVGYCIAVMLGNFNCVEGLYQCTTGKTTCSMEEYDGGRCPGWELTGGNQGEPFISNFDEVLSCPDDDSSVDKGYQTREACLVQLSGLRNDYNTSAQRDWVTSIDACPNPTPTVPATPVTPGVQKRWVCSPNYGGGSACDEWTVGQKNFPPGPNFPTEEKCKAECTPPRPPPTPPAPPTPPSPPTPCTYTGDKLVNSTSTPKFEALNPEWWSATDVGDSSCSNEIANCRSDMKNWHTKYGGDYAGFCLQTLNNNNGKGRGACGRKMVDKGDGSGFVNISDPGTIGTDPLEAADRCRDPHTNNNGNFAWVADTATSGVDACDPGCPKIAGRDGSPIKMATQTEQSLEREFDISA